MRIANQIFYKIYLKEIGKNVEEIIDESLVHWLTDPYQNTLHFADRNVLSPLVNIPIVDTIHCHERLTNVVLRHCDINDKGLGKILKELEKL